MRTAIILVALFAGVQALAQEKSQITVKTSAVNNGVVIVTAQTGKTSFELQCNKDISGCRVLEPGDYLMVRLPKNRGAPCRVPAPLTAALYYELGRVLGIAGEFVTACLVQPHCRQASDYRWRVWAPACCRLRFRSQPPHTA